MEKETNSNELVDMLGEDIEKHGKFTEDGLELKSVDGKTTKLYFKNLTKQILEQEKVRDIHKAIISKLKRFCDIKEEYYSIIALWIIGTYIHDEFETYPYLFFNAMRGSGKTRILKLIASMSKNGELLGSLSDAVLFRTAKGKTMCIDEFERVGSQENQSLRELLNAAYKKGQKIQRMKKVKENYVVEEFDVYTSICMANIWGMDEVLGDRCITIILEKSDNLAIIKQVENFGKDEEIKKIVRDLSQLECRWCMNEGKKNWERDWNSYIFEKYSPKDLDLHTLHTLPTPTSLTTPLSDLPYLFTVIDDTNISGRELELSMPFFIMASSMGILDETVSALKKIVDDKKAEYLIESKDIQIFDFVSQQNQVSNYISLNKLNSQFRDFIGVGEKEDNWINPRWFSRALKRLVLIEKKIRRSGGTHVILDIQKAQEKMKMFK